MVFVYILIVTVSSIIGALCGIGGGVIINPAIGAVSDYQAITIACISGLCVISMSIAAVVKSFLAKQRPQVKTATLLSIGAIVGGVLGNFVLDAVSKNLNDEMVKIWQYSIMILLIILVVVYINLLKPKGIGFNVKNPIAKLVCGLFLGLVSSFLGVGGGPFNMGVLCLFFGMELKEAAVNSLFIIIFGQFASLITRLIQGTFIPAMSGIAWYVIVFLIVGAVIGGLVGAALNKKLPPKKILLVYNAAMVLIIGLNAYNIIYNVAMM